MLSYRDRTCACLLAFLFLATIFCPLSVEANPEQAAPAQAHPIDLDLTSTQRTLPAPGFVQRAPVNILVGGASRPITPTAMVTPAERMAAYQVFSTGQQSILLGAAGNAVGGTFTMGPRFQQYVSSMVIPKGVTAVRDFGATSALNLAGNLTNAGTFLATSSNAAVTTAAITAANILNQRGALLTSVLPTGGLPGFTSAVSALNLNLTAINSLINHGTISSSGNLAMSAGGAITNSALMSAAHNISMTSAIGSITNSGVINAAMGNINIASQMAQTLAINNVGGVMKALNGSINATTAGLAQLGEKPNLSILGGDFVARELNVFSEHGLANINVDNLSGRLNVSAGEVHVTAATPNLEIGDMNITGDPTYYNTGGTVTISGDLNFSAQNLAIVASEDIINNGAISINTSGTNANGGSILMVAGANFTSTGPSSNNNDTTSVLTITPGPGSGGGSNTGGKINLTGLTTFNAGVNSGNGMSGTVTLVAFAGSNSDSGTINVPATIQTGTSENDVFAVNGNVVVIAGATSGNAITLAGINTSGNTVNPQPNNGAVFIASATPILIGNPGGVATASTLSAAVTAGSNTFTVNNPANYTVGQAVIINPFAADAEQVTVTAVSTITNTITTSTLVNNHIVAEPLFAPASSVVVQADAGTYGMPITLNGGAFAPGTAQTGAISIGSITSGANVVITTNGATSVTGPITLSQNPASGTVISASPEIYINANSLTVNSGGSINSTIAGQPNTVNIISPTVTNSGTISGNVVSVLTSNITNNSNITGTGSNAFVDIESTAGLTVGGNGTITVPALSVIELAAADTNTLQINGSQNFTTGDTSLIILSAQRPGSSIVLGANTTQTFAGNPVISINTPTLQLNNASNLNATGTATFAITGGFTANPLTISLASGATATISTAWGGAIKMRPIDGQNINITAPGSANFALVGSVAILATAGSGKTIINPFVNFIPSSYQIVQNPAGGIVGTAFQPYVGGTAATSGSGFVMFGAYTYPQVLALLGPVIATQQFQRISTYTQQFSAGFVNKAAKQVGLQVSAGVFVVIDANGTITSQPTTNSDIALALSDASKYGNIADIVVGNENIVGGNQPQASITTLTNLISTVQASRNTTTNPLTNSPFTSQTLPVTTRQIGGVYNIVNPDFPSSTSPNTTAQTAMKTLLQTVDGYAYGDFYPFLSSNVINAIAANPGMTQSQFTTLVINEMSAEVLPVAQIVKQVVGTQTSILVGETGYATAGVPQASVQFASWYYPAMQSWSAETVNPVTGKKGISISAYFEAYNEPWKPLTNGNQEPFWGIWQATGTSPSNGSSYTLTGITQKYTLPLYSLRALPPGATEAASIPQLRGPDFVPNNNSNNSLLNSQIATKLPTDTTPSSPATNQNPNVDVASALNTSPYDNLGSPGEGWESHSDNSFWSCSGCLGNSPQVKTGSAVRIVQAMANDLNETSTRPTYIASKVTNTASSATPAPSSSFFDLARGVALVTGKNPMVVGTQEGQVHIQKGALAFVVETGNDVCVYNLHDERAGSIKVVVGKNLLTLPPGKQLVLTRRQDAQFEEVNPGTKIGYRNPKPIKMSGGDVKAYVADFSIPSALIAVTPLRNMLKSDKPYERRVVNRMLKNAIITAELSPAAGPYVTTK